MACSTRKLARGGVIDTFTQQEPSEGAPATERTGCALLYDVESALHRRARVRLAAGGSHRHRDAPRLAPPPRRRQLPDHPRHVPRFAIGLHVRDEPARREARAAGVRGRRRRQRRRRRVEHQPRTGTACGTWPRGATTDGWIAEIAIPLVTLRSPDVDAQTWGINFMRNIRRKNEQVFWAPIPKPYALTQVSLAGTVTGMTALNRGLDLRIKPYRARRAARAIGPDRCSIGRGLRDVGLDVKYGMASGLNLDVTVNTDFAQAEVDEQQVNLTRFPLFFPEKRDFFLENSGQFTSARRASTAWSTCSSAVGSASPTPDSRFRSSAGARLTGKVGRGNNIAVLDLQTQERVRPARRELPRGALQPGHAGAFEGGRSLRQQGSDRRAHFNRTVCRRRALAPTRLLRVDGHSSPSRHSPGRSSGQAAGTVRELDQPVWQTYAEYTDIQDHFNAEVGFVPRTGIRTLEGCTSNGTRDPGGPSSACMEPMINIIYTTDQDNRLLTRDASTTCWARASRTERSLVLTTTPGFDQLDVPFRIRPDISIPARRVPIRRVDSSPTAATRSGGSTRGFATRRRPSTTARAPTTARPSG